MQTDPFSRDGLTVLHGHRFHLVCLLHSVLSGSVNLRTDLSVTPVMLKFFPVVCRKQSSGEDVSSSIACELPNSGLLLCSVLSFVSCKFYLEYESYILYRILYIKGQLRRHCCPKTQLVRYQVLAGLSNP